MFRLFGSDLINGAAVVFETDNFGEHDFLENSEPVLDADFLELLKLILKQATGVEHAYQLEKGLEVVSEATFKEDISKHFLGIFSHLLLHLLVQVALHEI